MYLQGILEYFNKILYFSVLFINYGYFLQFKFWKYLRSFWRKIFLPEIRLCKVLDI